MVKRERTNVQNADSRVSLLVQVARAYYLENRTQAEIADSLGISRSQVSRYLTEARDQGIVQVRIITPDDDVQDLRQSLLKCYPHLHDVVITPSFPDNPDALRASIGSAAARYVGEALVSSQRLALGCGRSLRATVDALPKRQLANVEVVQAMGNIGHEAHNVDYNEIARKAADALGARVYYLSAPAILGKGSGKASDLIMTNPPLEYALSLARHANVYVVGLGSLEIDQVYVRAGLIQQPELDDLRERAVGDICGRFFDSHGEEQQSAFADRIIGIELNDLRDASLAVGVAGGQDKVAPLLGALRGGFLNVLISDEQTVRSIVAVDSA
jgi:deoxyribonucleoside regulator